MTEKEYFRTHYDALKLKFDEQMVKLVEEETKLRALILKNQEIVEKWTTRQYTTADEIVTVELLRPTVVDVKIEVPNFIIKENMDVKLELIDLAWWMQDQ